MRFSNFLRSIRTKFANHQTLVEVLIYRDHLLGNLHQYQAKYPKIKFAPVLKSNAYGHGLIEVAKILDHEDLAFFMADSLFEAGVLRHAGVKTKILVLGYTAPENISFTRVQNCAFTLTDIEQAKELAANLRWKTKIHLKIDTGMHRQGILPEQLDAAIALIKSNKFIELEGVCSHFADSESQDQDFSLAQIQSWQQAVAKIKPQFSTIKYWHIANTAGVFYSDKVECNVARLGSGLYGYEKSPFTKFDLQPALQLQSVLGSVKDIPAGGRVGYNLTYTAEKPIKAATVPVGYFEGVDRRLSNLGTFKIKEFICPIIGLVSMNMTTIDVSAVPDVKAGDRVIIISANAADPNSAENIAKLAGTIAREILVHIPQHLRRTVV